MQKAYELTNRPPKEQTNLKEKIFATEQRPLSPLRDSLTPTGTVDQAALDAIINCIEDPFPGRPLTGISSSSLRDINDSISIEVIEVVPPRPSTKEFTDKHTSRKFLRATPSIAYVDPLHGAGFTTTYKKNPSSEVYT
jgi:hypothetical protein